MNDFILYLVLQVICGGKYFVNLPFPDILNFQKSRTEQAPRGKLTTLKGKWFQCNDSFPLRITLLILQGCVCIEQAL